MFEHHGKETLPMIEDRGVAVRLILGGAYGQKAPATMFSETFYADVTREAACRCRTITRTGASTSSKARSRSPARILRQVE